MDIKVSIEVIEPSGNITSYESSDQANISNLSKLAVPSLGSKLFYLSEDDNKITSPLDGEHLWADEIVGYSGWVSNTYSDSEGKFASGSEPTLVVKGSNLRYIVLYSDLVERHFVELVEVNGLIYTALDEKLIIGLKEDQEIITIKILKVSHPYQPVKLTSVEVGLVLDFTKQSIINYNFGSQSQGDADSIEYSVVARFGSIELDNNDKLFNNLNELDLLDNDLEAVVTLNNHPFGTYLLRKGKLNYGDTSATFELTDELIDIDQFVWNKSYYMEENISAKTFLDFIFNYIQKSYQIYDSVTEKVLNNTIFANSITEEENIKALLNKVCEATQCSIFKNNSGKIVIKHIECDSSEVS